MPKIVDRDARREEIVDAVWRLISRDGIAAATTRNIAVEAGCSNGVLSHYFADKGEILNATLLRGYRRVEERVRECLARTSGLAALREVLLLTVSIGEEARLGNQVELAFWGHAVGNPHLAGQHQVIWERYREIIGQLLLQARRRGQLAADADIASAADALAAVADGLGMEASLFPDIFSAERQRAVIDRMLTALGAKDRAIRPRARSTRKRSTNAQRMRKS